jgi:hypothetical protein
MSPSTAHFIKDISFSPFNSTLLPFSCTLFPEKWIDLIAVFVGKSWRDNTGLQGRLDDNLINLQVPLPFITSSLRIRFL